MTFRSAPPRQSVPYAQPPYPGMPGYGYPGILPPQPRNGLGTAALLLGIGSVLFCWTMVGGAVFGLVAIGLGIAGHRRVRRGEADNPGVALGGVVVGVLGLLATVAVVGLVVATFRSPTVQTFQDCIGTAQSQQQVDQCKLQFDRSRGEPPAPPRHVDHGRPV